MHELPTLSYSYKDLEPHFDARTMEIHHSKHHQSYVDKLNTALKGSEWEGEDLEKILSSIGDLPEDIRQEVINNGGGHLNHTLFFRSLSSSGKREPSGELREAIERSFGTLEGFKERMTEVALSHFASGWGWLVSREDGLAIYSTPGHDNPLLFGDTPLVTVDLWEHAYYLKYQNRRAEYVEAWWKVLDWSKAEEIFSRNQLDFSSL